MAEKLRLDLAWFHLTMEEFVEKASQHEVRLVALCLSIEELKVTNDAKLPQLATEAAKVVPINDQINQEWDHYRAEIDVRITES